MVAAASPPPQILDLKASLAGLQKYQQTNYSSGQARQGIPHHHLTGWEKWGTHLHQGEETAERGSLHVAGAGEGCRVIHLGCAYVLIGHHLLMGVEAGGRQLRSSHCMVYRVDWQKEKWVYQHGRNWR